MAAALRQFVFDGRVNWFPGHMAKALRQMQQRIANVSKKQPHETPLCTDVSDHSNCPDLKADVVIEVRDARVSQQCRVVSSVCSLFAASAAGAHIVM